MLAFQQGSAIWKHWCHGRCSTETAQCVLFTNWHLDHSALCLTQENTVHNRSAGIYSHSFLSSAPYTVIATDIWAVGIYFVSHITSSWSRSGHCLFGFGLRCHFLGYLVYGRSSLYCIFEQHLCKENCSLTTQRNTMGAWTQKVSIQTHNVLFSPLSLSYRLHWSSWIFTCCSLANQFLSLIPIRSFTAVYLNHWTRVNPQNLCRQQKKWLREKQLA